MELNLIKHIKKRRLYLKNKKEWTRADEMYYINFLKLVDNHPEFLEDLQRLRNTEVKIFGQCNEKKVGDYCEDRKRFLNKYGPLLKKYGFKKGIGIMGLPIRRRFVQFPLSFCCQKCGLIFDVDLPALFVPYNMLFTRGKYRCPRCKSRDSKRHLRLIVDIFKETTERDIKDFINRLPSSAGAVEIGRMLKSKKKIPTGWKFIEMLKKKIYGIKRSRVASKSERDKRWFELSRQGKDINEIIKITKEEKPEEIQKLVFRKIRQDRIRQDTELCPLTEDKKKWKIKYSDGNLKSTVKEEEFKSKKADVEEDLPELIKQAIKRYLDKNT